MEIQKVFSNIEDPEETLYSVLMSENEVTLYSEFRKHVDNIGSLLDEAVDSYVKNSKRAEESIKSYQKHAAEADRLRHLRRNKTLGGIAAGTLATAGLAYGAKKLYDKRKNKDNK